MLEHAAFEVGTDLALDEAGDGRTVPTRTRQEGLELFPDDFVKEGFIGLVAFVLDGKGPSGPEPSGKVNDQKAACSKAFRRVVYWHSRGRGPAIERRLRRRDRSAGGANARDDSKQIGPDPEMRPS
jgi:hypothetical protein